MKIRRQMIVLDVPIMENESAPESWDWDELIDSPYPVLVMGKGAVYTAEVDGG